MLNQSSYGPMMKKAGRIISKSNSMTKGNMCISCIESELLQEKQMVSFLNAAPDNSLYILNTADTNGQHISWEVKAAYGDKLHI